MINEQIQALAAKNKIYKYVLAFTAFVAAGLFALLNMPAQSQQAVQIGNEVAQVVVTDGKITEIVSATAAVNVIDASPTH